jgi:hypothetical protein
MHRAARRRHTFTAEQVHIPPRDIAAAGADLESPAAGAGAAHHNRLTGFDAGASRDGHLSSISSPTRPAINLQVSTMSTLSPRKLQIASGIQSVTRVACAA